MTTQDPSQESVSLPSGSSDADSLAPGHADPGSKAWSEFYDSDINVRRIYALIGTQWPLIQRVLRLPPNSRLLETGVGTGIMACYLSNLGYQVTAIDNDAGVLRQVRELAGKLASKLTLVQMDMFSLGFRNHKFHAAYHQGVLEHLPISRIRAAITAQLSISQKVIFSVPSWHYPWRSLGDENLWDIREWRDILRGFNVAEMFGYDFISSSRLEEGLQKSILYLWPGLSTRLKSMQYGFVITPGVPTQLTEPWTP